MGYALCLQAHDWWHPHPRVLLPLQRTLFTPITDALRRETLLAGHVMSAQTFANVCGAAPTNTSPWVPPAREPLTVVPYNCHRTVRGATPVGYLAPGLIASLAIRLTWATLGEDLPFFRTLPGYSEVSGRSYEFIVVDHRTPITTWGTVACCMLPLWWTAGELICLEPPESPDFASWDTDNCGTVSLAIETFRFGQTPPGWAVPSLRCGQLSTFREAAGPETCSQPISSCVSSSWDYVAPRRYPIKMIHVSQASLSSSLLLY